MYHPHFFLQFIKSLQKNKRFVFCDHFYLWVCIKHQCAYALYIDKYGNILSFFSPVISFISMFLQTKSSSKILFFCPSLLNKNVILSSYPAGYHTYYRICLCLMHMQIEVLYIKSKHSRKGRCMGIL
jgi:hypothetical protein